MAVTDMRAWMKMVIRRIVKLERAQLRLGRGGGGVRYFTDLNSLKDWNAPAGSTAFLKQSVTGNSYMYRVFEYKRTGSSHSLSWTLWTMPEFENLPLADGVRSHTSGDYPGYRIVSGVLYFKGTVSRTSGNWPTSGQVDISKEIPELAEASIPSDGYATGAMLGPTGGMIARGYLSGGTVKFGATTNYGNAASYLSLTGISGIFATTAMIRGWN